MGAATVSKFYRLYMFPGVYHCGGGYGPNVFDLLTPLANWVEAGHAPNSIVAALVSGGTGAAGTGPATGTVELTRPVGGVPVPVRLRGMVPPWCQGPGVRPPGRAGLSLGRRPDCHTLDKWSMSASRNCKPVSITSGRRPRTAAR